MLLVPRIKVGVQMKRGNSKHEIIEQIRRLGVQEGDLLFLAADLMMVGYFNKNKDTTYRDWLDILLKVVGDQGTLVIPAHSEAFSGGRKMMKRYLIRKRTSFPVGCQNRFLWMKGP